MALWNVEWLVKTHGGVRSVPAFDFLLDQPSAVRMQLLAIVDAVRTTGPDQWRDTADGNPAPFAVADDFARKALTAEEGD